MKIFGYSINDPEKNKLLTMQEICLELGIDEMDELIEYLTYVRNRHASLKHVAHMPHTHYSDWKGAMGKTETEIVVSTIFEENPPKYINLTEDDMKA
jgi:Cys-tRNA synthase (O-phospho-L-seryl-tRNA:Cys-tRNA synthase)